MKVQILKTHYRFQMHCPYNHKVLKVVKKIQKRYYNKNTKTWYFPIEEYQGFKDALPEFEFEVTESKTVVFIKTLADRIEIKFSKFIEEFKKYLEFSGRRYNSAERKITMPKEHLEKVLLFSKEIVFEIVITDEILVE